MHYNRKPLIGYDGNPREKLFINIDKEDFSIVAPHPIVNISGSSAVHQHEITFITGATHCRAHALAKMIAAAVLNGNYPFAQSLKVARQVPDEQLRDDHDGSQVQPTPGKVLWIDTVHSFYTACGFIDDLKRSFNVNNENFQLMCFDVIGTFNENSSLVHDEIFKAIDRFKPTLIVIDDLDHLTPECGMFSADNFYLMMREVLDHYSTALLCVGYNLIGRAKSTAGFIGKQLFPVANNIFRVTNKGTTSVVQRIRGVTCDDQLEFAFTINEHNFPQEVIPTPDDSTVEARFVETTAVEDIFASVITRDETLTPDDLITRLNKRQESINRSNRNRHLIANARARGIISRNSDGHYTINDEVYNNPERTKQPQDDYMDNYIRNLKKASKIPIIPPNKQPDALTFINRRARPSTP